MRVGGSREEWRGVEEGSRRMEGSRGEWRGVEESGGK